MRKILVAYFSASGVTAKVANTLAESIGADIHEIVPQELYTDADLNWNNKNSRSSVEMNDKAFRPAIANKISDVSQYDTIFVGFPIWWYVAPTIINTFLEQYDLIGKKIIPFATSGMSGMGNTNKELKNSCHGATLVAGNRLDENISSQKAKAWAESKM